jgi:uncharacterized protein YndB with AHSA1/START domain
MNALAPITISTTIAAPISTVWHAFNDPAAVQQWNQASPDWHCPRAECDFKEGGTFSYTMAAKDGSFQFDFAGTYTRIQPEEYVAFTLGDGRKVSVHFTKHNDGSVLVEETFDPEATNPINMQQMGWQSILDSFKKFVEAQ